MSGQAEPFGKSDGFSDGQEPEQRTSRIFMGTSESPGEEVAQFGRRKAWDRKNRNPELTYECRFHELLAQQESPSPDHGLMRQRKAGSEAFAPIAGSNTGPSKEPFPGLGTATFLQGWKKTGSGGLRKSSNSHRNLLESRPEIGKTLDLQPAPNLLSRQSSVYSFAVTTQKPTILREHAEIICVYMTIRFI